MFRKKGWYVTLLAGLRNIFCEIAYGPRQANLVLIAYASSESSGEPAHPHSLARIFAAHSYKQWIKRNLQTESQIPGPSEWLGMRSWSLSWHARRHKFAWWGSYYLSFHRFACLTNMDLIIMKNHKNKIHILVPYKKFASRSMLALRRQLP